ncbi:hypothetical protein [Wohlfahrtiimonas larvae]|uniref:Uncharacterized protein n=1 Tax=Wohlfahrtiimonas larvae TaxID=1157986 RepID=A0ABP9MQ24_9GAMM|nr:hypothetical protein [Wohlfahrtiimonas larvae]
MLKILGLLAIMAVISAIVYKLFFSFRKKHIGSGNIFYVCANGAFNEDLDTEKVHQENLHILTAGSTETVNIMDGMITQNILSRDNHAQHRILINGMPVGYLKTETAMALKQEKEELGIHSGLIYCKVKITKTQNNKMQATLDLPPISRLAKVLSNRSFEHSAEKFSKLK